MAPGLNLRPHHLICANLFSGKGYSPEFIQNIARVKLELSMPGTRVLLTSERDDICASCPRSECADQPGNAANFDRRVLEAFGLTPGQEYMSSFLSELVREKAREIRLEEICGECEWFGELCRAPWQRLGGELEIKDALKLKDEPA